MKLSLLIFVAAAALVGCASQQPATPPLVASQQPMTAPSVATASSCAPRYPLEAKRYGLQGKVVVRVMVEPTGTVSRIELGQTSGSQALDQAAMEAAKCQHYHPGTIGGVPSALWTEFPVNFVLAANEPRRSAERVSAPTYGEQITAAIRPHVSFPDAAQLPGNPGAEFAVSVRPDGQIANVELTKSSGYPGWDAAARSALIKTEVLPFDVNGNVPSRLLVMLRPKR